MAQSKKHIVVIGAGVIGLQNAVSLLEAGYEVTILAKHFPGDESIEYTSPWAGAHWRPDTTATNEEQMRWDIDSYKHWLNIIRKEDQEPSKPKSGMAIRKSEYFSPNPSLPWFSKEVLDFKQTGTKSIAGQLLHSYSYQAVMINVSMYLQSLLDTAVSLGASTHRIALPKSTNLAGTLRYATDIVRFYVRATPISAFVNATGISARTLVPDESVFPIRGQTVLVKGEAKGITTVDAVLSNPGPETPNLTYILPRPYSGTTILGGMKTKGDWKGEVSAKTTKMILGNTKTLAPELLNEKGEFEVLSSQVGLRPGREGGARVEVEEVQVGIGAGKKMVVCHAYGHSGAGYQKSVGSAEKVVKLLGEYFQINEGGRARL